MATELPIEPPVREKLRSKNARISTPATLEDRVRETLTELRMRGKAERLNYVKSQLGKNSENLQRQLREVERISTERNHCQPGSSAASGNNDDEDDTGSGGLLLARSRLALLSVNSGQPCGTGNLQPPQICPKLKAGNVDARKIVFEDTCKLEAVSRLPSCTAWMFVDRNERMAKDQSIAQRRRIFYESNGKETFFCPDDEEEKEAADDEEGIRSLSESEEHICRMTILEHGSGRGVLETIADFLQVSVAQVEGRFLTESSGNNINNGLPPATIHSDSQDFRRPIHNSFQYRHSLGTLQEDEQEGVEEVAPAERRAKAVSGNEGEEREEETKTCGTLAQALDSFDSLFCRRCLVFNCATHAGVEEIVTGVSERQAPCAVPEGDPLKPCSPRCRFFASKAWQGNNPGGSGIQEGHNLDGGMRASVAEIIELDDDDDSEDEDLLEFELRTNSSGSSAREVAAVEEILNSQGKKKTLPIFGETVVTKRAKNVGDEFLDVVEVAPIGRTAADDAESSSDSMAFNYERKHPSIPPIDEEVFIPSRPTTRSMIAARKEKQDVPSDRWCFENAARTENLEVISEPPCFPNGMDAVPQTEASPTNPSNEWNRMEQDLCEKGIQIFGKNSCLIAQTVLKGCKSCQEIADYICKLDMAAAANVDVAPSADVVSSERGNDPTNVELPHPGRVFRPKFRFGRKKVAARSAVGAIRKRIGKEGGGLNLCRQYTPCSCESSSGCGKDCPCVLRDTHCEKYCGCFKVCTNRFRGCQCAKSLCDRRHCPCFAAGRECDPDVCKFCWIERGHSALPECQNMRILQRKKKRLLLARSDVCSGWGVFTKYPLNKNDYIGEYTGELISHGEADQRGRIYDRETSFLFNLNDKLVVDAFRKGNKLKFANHSARKPNCYAKVLLVGGDHRVGIFAKDKIEAGEELLYDYQYEPEIAPLWATAAE